MIFEGSTTSPAEPHFFRCIDTMSFAAYMTCCPLMYWIIPKCCRVDKMSSGLIIVMLLRSWIETEPSRSCTGEVTLVRTRNIKFLSTHSRFS